MKLGESESSFCVAEDEELELNGKALADLVKAVLAKEAKFRFRARGGSMHPCIKDRDTLTIAPLKMKQPVRGDIIAFVRPQYENLAVHRIVARSNKGYITRGDNNLEADGPVVRANILGKIVRIERNGKSIRFGLGSERKMIAVLTGNNLWLPLLKILRNIIHPFKR